MVLHSAFGERTRTAVEPFAALAVAPSDDHPVAVGGVTDDATILAAACLGFFPMAVAPRLVRVARARHRRAAPVELAGRRPEADPWQVLWWFPEHRPLLLSTDDLRLGKGLTRVLARYGPTAVVRPAADVRQAVARCLDGRPSTWFSPSMVEAVLSLHRRGLYAGYELVLETGHTATPAAVTVGTRTQGFVSLDTAAGAAEHVALLNAAVALAHLRDGVAVDLQWPREHLLRLCHAPRPSTQFPRADPAQAPPPAWEARGVDDVFATAGRGR